MTTSNTPTSNTPTPNTLRLGTRGSALAMAQSALVAEAVRAETGREVELVPIVTAGDASDAPVEQFGGTGVFAAAVRDAVASGEVDFAVHSLKDLPTAPDERLVIAAIPRREDPRDALVARDGLTLGELPAGSRVGTGSPRRVAQLNALGLGVETVAIRGNVETRLARVGDDLDAVILARAGLLRVGRADEISETIDPLQMLPAPGQGALAIECRVDDDALISMLRVLDDPDTRAAVTAERTLLATLEAGCTAPVGALAEIAVGDDGDELWLRAVVADPSGAPTIRSSITGLPEQAAHVGQQLAVELLSEGADHLVGAP